MRLWVAWLSIKYSGGGDGWERLLVAAKTKAEAKEKAQEKGQWLHRSSVVRVSKVIGLPNDLFGAMEEAGWRRAG